MNEVVIHTHSELRSVVVDDNATQIADLMQWAVRRIRHHSAKEMAPLGLTPGQSRTLRTVLRAGGPIRMTDIAARLDIVPRAATSQIDAIEESGLVCRQLDPADRRAVLVCLTPRGRALRDRLDAARARAASTVLRPLSEPDQLELLRLLTSVCGPCCEERR